MADGSPKRLAPDKRKAALLDSAIAVLKRDGLASFSLDAVAREAGVALTLPRHYFGSTRDLLKAAIEDLLQEVEPTLLGRKLQLSLHERYETYLSLMAKNPWAHRLWMESSVAHSEVKQVVQAARKRMAESMWRKPWKDLSIQEQFDARGRIAYIETVVEAWLETGAEDSKQDVIELIARIGAVTTESGRNPIRKK